MIACSLASSLPSPLQSKIRSCEAVVHCACRTSTVSSCAFHEQWRSALHLLSSFFPLAEGGGWLWCSSLRPSREHRFTVRTLGAGGTPSRRTITQFLSFSPFLHPERKASRQEGNQVAPSLRVSEKGLYCHSSKGAARLFFTARIEGPPFHRGTTLPDFPYQGWPNWSLTARVQRGPSDSSYLPLGEWPRLPFTARIERAQFDRARSASKKGTWPLPSLTNQPLTDR